MRKQIPTQFDSYFHWATILLFRHETLIIVIVMWSGGISHNLDNNMIMWAFGLDFLQQWKLLIDHNLWLAMINNWIFKVSTYILNVPSVMIITDYYVKWYQDLTRLLRRHHNQSACLAYSRQSVRWPTARRGATVVERGKTVAKHWPAGGCQPDRSWSPASATWTPLSVGSGRPQP